MLTTDDLAFEQVAGLKNLHRKKTTRVISIAGGKGGVGKSNVSVNLGISLAKQNQKVMLLDADMGLANLDVLLGLKSELNLFHVLQGKCDLEDIIIAGPHNLKIVPAASGIQKMAQLNTMETTGIIHAFSHLTDDVDVLIVDNAAGISEQVMSLSQASQEVIVVVCNEPTSITDAYALIKVMNRNYNIDKFHILTNMVKNFSEGKELFNKISKAADRFLDVTLQFAGSLPYDEYLRKAVQQQKAVVDLYPNSKSAMAFKQISQKVQQWPKPKANRGHISFFLERLLQHDAMLEGCVE